MAEQVTKPNRYEHILDPELPAERRDYYLFAAKWMAYYGLLTELGRHQNLDIDLARGSTTLSIPSFFRLPKFQNPVNEAALAMLPKFKEEAGPFHDTDVRVDNRTLASATYGTPEDYLSATRKGESARFVVDHALGLDDRSRSETLRMAIGDYWWDEHSSRRDLHSLSGLVKEVPLDLQEHVVGEASSIASFVSDRGYTDFLDYLVDTQTIVYERVDAIFSSPANHLPEE